jgi:hypothetical protein
MNYNTHINFLRDVENHAKEHIYPQRKRSRYEELYKEKRKLRENERQPSEAVEFP